VKETYIELQEELPPASIVISNHSGYMEILYSSMRYGCCYVSKAAMASKPIFGTLMKCQQCIFVDRESGKSHAGEQIIERARHPDDWPMLAMYPEGTTTNGGQMISFRSGAFIAGAPIRPLIVKYRSWLFDPAFTCCTANSHFLQVLMQPISFMEVVHLPTCVGARSLWLALASCGVLVE